jgi:outer membrane biogenesis lipoprotein LolB
MAVELRIWHSGQPSPTWDVEVTFPYEVPTTTYVVIDNYDVEYLHHQVDENKVPFTVEEVLHGL